MKCPNCGETIHVVDLLESDFCDNHCLDSVEGTCSNCGKSWRWIEVFILTFDHCEDIEEIEINDHL